MPISAIIPFLVYPNVPAARAWLAEVFGFTERWRVGDHHAQLNVGAGGAITIGEPPAGEPPAPPQTTFRAPSGDRRSYALLVRVEDVDDHHVRAADRGATILQPPTDHPYGERQYTALDLAGHRWTFSQSIGDVAPEAWGATSAPGD